MDTFISDVEYVDLKNERASQESLREKFSVMHWAERGTLKLDIHSKSGLFFFRCGLLLITRLQAVCCTHRANMQRIVGLL